MRERAVLRQLLAIVLCTLLVAPALPAEVAVTYDYDAFGNLLHSSTTLSSPTYNNYLFAGEQFDPDLNLYYNRARYLNVSTGRFWTMDAFEGDLDAPLSLHRYLYVNAEPVNNHDPGGLQTTIDEALEVGLVAVIFLTFAALLSRVKPFPLSIERTKPGPDDDEDAQGSMGVQLQAHAKGFESDPTIGPGVINALDSNGVRVSQINWALDQVYILAQTVTWFPFNRLDDQLLAGISLLKVRIARFPSFGGISGYRPNFEQELIPDRRGIVFRIDIDNYRGHNLRFLE